MSHFGYVFKDHSHTNISSQLQVVQNYPRLFSLEEGQRIGMEVSLKEIEEI